MIDSSAQAGQVQLTLHRGDGHSDSTSSFPIDWQSVHGLSRAQVDAATAQNLGFDIVREAGAFHCEGYFKAGNGAGTFSFTPNASFLAEMRSLGYNRLTSEDVYAMAIHDIGLKFVRDLKNLGYHATADDLVTMRIHGVTIEYIHDLQSHGLKDLSIDQLVNLKIHGISD
jgi:hypothetical protein